MMKKVLVLSLIMLMSFTMVFAGGQSETAAAADDGGIAPLKINIYHGVADPFIMETVSQFADLVKERSNGAITCNITPAGTLGGEREASQLMLMGDIDMSVMSIDALDWLVPNVGMSWPCLPGLITSWDDVDEFNTGWMFERQKEVAAENGVDLICPGEFGLKVLEGTGDPINSMEDLKGLTVRVPDIPFHHSYFQALGALPISGVNMYTGLQQGTMDAVHNNIPASQIFKLEEVIDWILLTWDMYGTTYWVANGEFSDKLSDAQKEIITDACFETAANLRATWRGIADTWVQKCVDDPTITVVEPSAEMQAAMQAIAYDVWEEYRDIFDPVAMERIFKENM